MLKLSKNSNYNNHKLIKDWISMEFRQNSKKLLKKDISIFKESDDYLIPFVLPFTDSNKIAFCRR